jgi:hypothetical protein
MSMYEDRRANRHRFIRRNWFWIAPLGLAAGAGFFIGIGFLVAWLWRVTLGDIFGFKPISFWQAWGLILLSQILFKANMHRSVAAGHMRHHRCECAAGPAEPQPGV